MKSPQLRQQEGTPISTVVLAFSCIFLVMTSYYILKPVRDALFLEELGSRRLPWVHLIVLAVTFFTASVYTWATRVLSRERLLTYAMGFCLICIAIFWVLLAPLGGIEGLRVLTAWVYFCWVSVFSVFAVTLFWSLIHTVFTTQTGAKSYGYVGAGATCGAIAGGGITGWLAEPIGMEHLLLIAACVLSPCLLCGRLLIRRSRDQATQGPTEDSQSTSTKSKGAIELFRHSTYLSVLFAIVFLWVFIMVLDEYRHGRVIETSLPGDNEKAAYFGSIYFYANLIGLFFSFVLTGPVLSRWGPRPGLLIFAGLIVASAVGLLVAPGFELVTMTKVAYPAWGYSIGQWSRELLYTQTSTDGKFVAKGYIDTVGFRAGAGGAAIALIVAAEIGSGPDGLLTNAVTQLSFVTIPLGILLALLAWWISAEFRRLQGQTAA